MRLSNEHRGAIVSIIKDICGPDARVRLFGSRVDDEKRGGDVDLLVELPYEPDDIYALQRELGVKLLRGLDTRPADVLVVGPKTRRLPVHEAALRDGVLL